MHSKEYPGQPKINNLFFFFLIFLICRMKRERFTEELKTVLGVYSPDSPTDVNLSPYQLTLGMLPFGLEGQREPHFWRLSRVSDDPDSQGRMREVREKSPEAIPPKGRGPVFKIVNSKEMSCGCPSNWWPSPSIRNNPVRAPGAGSDLPNGLCSDHKLCKWPQARAPWHITEK